MAFVPHNLRGKQLNFVVIVLVSENILNGYVMCAPDSQTNPNVVEKLLSNGMEWVSSGHKIDIAVSWEQGNISLS